MAGDSKTSGNGRWIWPTVISVMLALAIFLFGLALAQANGARYEVQELARDAAGREARLQVVESNLQTIKDDVSYIRRRMERE